MLQPEFQIPPLFSYFAVFLWALSGAIVGMHKRYDLSGVFVIAVRAATGGSTLRDGHFLQTVPPVLTEPNCDKRATYTISSPARWLKISSIADNLPAKYATLQGD